MAAKMKVKETPGTSGRIATKVLFEDGTYSMEEFHKTFLEMEDMTEYSPAIALVGSWREWQRIKRDWPSFCNYIDDWKAELTVKLRSKALKKITTLAEGDDAKALQAAKFIADEGWDGKRGKGRPTKAERTREARRLAAETADTVEEARRVEEALTVYIGGKGE